jgi:hypothetical protein
MLNQSPKNAAQQVAPGKSPGESWLEFVHRRVSSMPFGEVQIVIHDSKVVQIAITQKTRLTEDHAR